MTESKIKPVPKDSLARHERIEEFEVYLDSQGVIPEGEGVDELANCLAGTGMTLEQFEALSDEDTSALIAKCKSLYEHPSAPNAFLAGLDCPELNER